MATLTATAALQRASAGAGAQLRERLRACVQPRSRALVHGSRRWHSAAKRVIVGMSGGVDSTVSALLLKQQGLNVHGVYMRNWDARDQDWLMVEDSCRLLGIPCSQMDLSKEYWTDVFDPFLADVQEGRISNPDVQCNRMIKFGAFYRRCQQVFGSPHGEAVPIAFGHYARTETRADGQTMLLRSVDKTKDQTYFLSQVSQDVLRNVMFPIGHLLKTDVKGIARRHGLDRAADRRESMGICFVGPRPFGDFVGQYVEQTPGDFVNEHGLVVGRHRGLGWYTVGQRAMIPGLQSKLYVVDKDMNANSIRVVEGRDHPALFTTGATVRNWHWIADHGRQDALPMDVTVKYRSRMEPVRATLALDTDRQSLRVVFAQPQHSVPCGQDMVAYDGQVCLGGGRIHETKPV
ncbi:tRNA(5-methylaminomethyl-2-thiouridylate)-methyl transferase [Entophlyctis helioformis]|nr:tRNA(5-methylaminomethyl-2-thiouridylate)-methyl transferase [Entophlyctis helioformis]